MTGVTTGVTTGPSTGSQGAYIFGCSGKTLLPEEAAFFAESNPWGFILFARNVDSPDQLRRLTDDLRACVGREAVITIDQEGGRVERLTPPQWRHWMTPLDQVKANLENAERSMYLRYRIIADELRMIGVDSNCAPCADVATADTHPFLYNRCYGEDAATVGAISRAAADGLLDGGVLPILKHIPGHGRATSDSHLEMPRVSAKRADLEASDFAAMKAVADIPLGMSAHVIYEDIDPVDCATTSTVMTQLVRDQIGFGGLLMTDDISMKALQGSLVENTRASLAAGMDLILHCNSDMVEMQAVAQETGAFTAAAQTRADAALSKRISPDIIDISAFEAELAGLLNRRVDG